MRTSRSFLIVSVVVSSFATAGCQSKPATDGSGYQIVRFSDTEAAILASQDDTAGPAIASNNAQCRADPACRK